MGILAGIRNWWLGEATPQNTFWAYEPCNTSSTPLAIRREPIVDGPRCGQNLNVGEQFEVCEEVPDTSGAVLFLKLADGRGWVFDVNPAIGTMCTRCSEAEYTPEPSVFQGESVHGSGCRASFGASFVQGESVCGRRSSFVQGESFAYQDGSVAVDGSMAVSESFQGYPTTAAPATARPSGPYQARPEDPIDVEIAEFFRWHPEVFAVNRGFVRISPGHYLLQGREIIVEKQSTVLMVRDGPLRQPLADYLCNSESSAQYSGSVFKAKTNLQSIPQADRMTFADTGQKLSRIDAMKEVKRQAAVREKAASGMSNKTAVSFKYEKPMDRTLGLTRTPEKSLSFMSTCSAVASPVPMTTRMSPASPQHGPAGARSPRAYSNVSVGLPGTPGSASKVMRPPPITLSGSPQALRSPTSGVRSIGGA